jgi:hypothetical protein
MNIEINYTDDGFELVIDGHTAIRQPFDPATCAPFESRDRAREVAERMIGDILKVGAGMESDTPQGEEGGCESAGEPESEDTE